MNKYFDIDLETFASISVFTFLYFAHEGLMTGHMKEAAFLIVKASLELLLIFALANVCQDFTDQVPRHYLPT